MKYPQPARPALFRLLFLVALLSASGWAIGCDGKADQVKRAPANTEGTASEGESANEEGEGDAADTDAATENTGTNAKVANQVHPLRTRSHNKIVHGPMGPRPKGGRAMVANRFGTKVHPRLHAADPLAVKRAQLAGGNPKVAAPGDVHGAKIKTEGPSVAAKADAVDGTAEKPADNVQVHSFGTVKQGTVVKNTFTLTNPSDKKMLIMDVKSTCGCTTGAPSKEIVAPGESTTIEVSVDTKGRKGKLNKRISVKTSVHDEVQILEMAGHVTIPVRLAAESWDVGELKSGESKSIEIFVETDDDYTEPVSIVSVGQSHAMLTTEAIEKDGVAGMRITLTNTAEKGRNFSATAFARTSFATSPHNSVRVSALLLGGAEPKEK